MPRCASRYGLRPARLAQRLQHNNKEIAEPGQHLHLSTADPTKVGFHPWLNIQSARWLKFGSARTLDYSLKRWGALGRFLQDGALSVDNNHIERLMRPWAMGRKAWLFAGSELAGKRAAMVMSLVQSAKLNGHDPWAYLKDVLQRLQGHPNHRIEELLPHRWGQAADTMPMHEAHRNPDR